MTSKKGVPDETSIPSSRPTVDIIDIVTHSASRPNPDRHAKTRQAEWMNVPFRDGANISAGFGTPRTIDRQRECIFIDHDLAWVTA